MAKLTLDRERFLTAWKLVLPAVPSRSPKPVLQCVRMDAGPEGTVLQGTNLETGIRVAVQGVEASEPVQVLLPPGRFGQILNECGSESMELDVHENTLQVRAGRGRFRLQLQSACEFPIVEPIADEPVLTMAGSALRVGLQRTHFACDEQSSRYALGGVFFEQQAGNLYLVATDGRRLATWHQSGEKPTGDQPGAVVPNRAVQMLMRSLGDSPVRLGWDPNRAWASWDGVDWFARCVDGRFPKWRDVLPNADGLKAIEIPVGVLATAWRQAAIVASQESRAIDATFCSGALRLRAQTTEVGESEVELPISYDGPDIAVSLDHGFVSEMLACLQAEQMVSVQLQDSESTVLFRPDESYTYLVMPLARQ